MAGAANRSKTKVSPSSARAHTRPKPTRNTSPKLPSGIYLKVLLVLFVGILAWGYRAIQTPPAKICGSLGGPPITGPRIKLRDGRHLAFKEHGVSKEFAKYKILYLHPYASCRHDPAVGVHLSPETAEELGVYIVTIDRPGYGESDPHPSRTLKSFTEDIEELADQLGLGSKFYIIGFSMGGALTWSCLQYIPHRLAGVSLLTPAVNYWWSGFPANLSTEEYKKLLPRDQWAFSLMHHTPWLSYLWNFPKWSLSSSFFTNDNPNAHSQQDREIAAKLLDTRMDLRYPTQQGDAESVHRDLLVLFSKWEFSPMDLENPFPNSGASVHLWQGDEDRIVPVKLQKYLAQRLPWVRYHELPGSGHLFPYLDGLFDKIVKVMLTSE